MASEPSQSREIPLQISIENQNRFDTVNVDTNMSVTDLAITYLHQNSLAVPEGLNSLANRLFQLVARDPHDPARLKLLNSEMTLQEVGLSEDTQVSLRINEAVCIELINQNGNANNVILPSFLPLAQIVEAIIGSAIGTQHFFHIIDTNLPAGLRRLDPNKTLGELGITNDTRMFLLPEFTLSSQYLMLANTASNIPTEQVRHIHSQNSVLQKSVAAYVDIVNMDGGLSRKILSVDSTISEVIERLGRDLYPGEPIKGLSLQLLKGINERWNLPSGDAPFQLTPNNNRYIYSGADENLYEVIGVLQSGQMVQIVGVTPNRDWYQIIYPSDAKERGWIKVQAQDKLSNIAQIPIIEKILSFDSTLWNEGIRQAIGQSLAIPKIQLVRTTNLLDRLTYSFRTGWEVQKLSIASAGLLIRLFSENYMNPQTSQAIYLRSFNDNLYFQKPLWALGSEELALGMGLYEFLRQWTDEIAPARFVIDENKFLALSINTTLRSYEKLINQKIDPLEILESRTRRCEQDFKRELDKKMVG